MKLKINIFITIVLSAPIINLIVKNIIGGKKVGLGQNIAFSILCITTMIILWVSYFLLKKK